MTQGTIKIDLLESEKRRRHWRLDPMAIILLAVVLACNAAFAFYGQQLVASVEDRQAEVRQVQQDKKGLEASLPVIDERRARIARLDDQIRVIRGLVDDPVRYANLLTELAERLPSNVWLSSLSIDPGSSSVQLAGTAAQETGRLPLATVARLIQNLNDSRCFSDAALASTAQSGPGFSFAITVHYDPQAAVEVMP